MPNFSPYFNATPFSYCIDYVWDYRTATFSEAARLDLPDEMPVDVWLFHFIEKQKPFLLLRMLARIAN